MIKTITPALAMALVLAACSDSKPAEQVNQDMPATTPADTAAEYSESKTVLGMTMRQLRDADIVNADGLEIGEVERIVRDATGTVTKLLVEVEDSDPDYIVEIPLEGLTPKQNGDDWDLVTSMSRDDLMALPNKK